MKRLFRHIIIVIITFTVMTSYAQKDSKGYRFEGNEIVFTFHKHDYDRFFHDTNQKKIKFEDLTIDNVVVAGEFNDWSRYDWKMRKVNETTYELRKHINEFKDEFSWEFKFLVNNEWWAEPDETDPNVQLAGRKGSHLNIYNLKMNTNAAVENADGNVRFRLRGYDEAKNVILSGSFNRWNEEELRLYRIENGWEITLDIKPGEYEYKFIVDGEWIQDPSNPSMVWNEYGGVNSLINVGKYVTFLLEGYQDAERVILAGSFNDWNDDDIELELQDNGLWQIRLPLPAGKHYYKFVVDGEWILDPDNPVKEYDGEGNINSVFMVK